MSAREDAVVIGIGQDAAGDDGIGLLVARALAMQGVAAIEATDATAIVTVLSEGRRVVVVDAVVGRGAAGAVVRLRPGELAAARRPMSSHGIGVVGALALAEALHGPDVLRAVEIVGVIVEGEPHLGSKLSREVAAAVGPAAALAVRLAVGPANGSPGHPP